MKIILFAYRNCGYECLRHLITINKKPALVVIPKKEDQQERVFKSVKKLAGSAGVKFFEYEKNNEILKQNMINLRPDFGFSCYFPYIIPKNILQLFKNNSFNIHGGILPDYKGALSSVWSIVNDAQESGSTMHLMSEKVDSGDIIEIKKCNVDYEDTGFSLYNKISDLSVDLFKKYISLIYDKQELKVIKQVRYEGKYYNRDIPYGGKINWQWNSRMIYNLCRALYFPPFKSAITSLNHEELEIHSVIETKVKSTRTPGTILDIQDNSIKVSTSDLDVLINIENIESIESIYLKKLLLEKKSQQDGLAFT